ncbi:MAG: NADH:flavin oxidoreductase/NADH oxidase [Rhizomicrobium sp.]
MIPSNLFSHYQLRGVQLKNRIMVSPMWQYVGEQGNPTDWHLMNLGRLAEGGAGLVFQEGTTIERRGCGTLGDLGIWDELFVPGLTRLASTIRSNGAVPGVQLMHAGRKARQKPPFEGRGPLERSPKITDWDEWDVIAPSAIAVSEHAPVPREMQGADIVAVQQAWVAAARRAAQAGYDVLNIHGAHGYLVHQFPSEISNRRTDSYGGSFNNRVRFLIEAVEGIRTVWPDAKPLMLRLSVVDHGWPIEESVRLVNELKLAGVDMIDCSSGGLTDRHFRLARGRHMAIRYRWRLIFVARPESRPPRLDLSCTPLRRRKS